MTSSNATTTIAQMIAVVRELVPDGPGRALAVQTDAFPEVSPDGRLLAECSDQDLHLWDLRAGKEVARRKGVRGQVLAVEVNARALVPVTRRSSWWSFRPVSASHSTGSPSNPQVTRSLPSRDSSPSDFRAPPPSGHRAALPGKEPGTYLLEGRAVAVVPVPQLLPELLASGQSAALPPSLLAVGEVDYGAQHINKFTPRRLRRLLQDLGLQQVRVRPYLGFAPFASPRPNLAPKGWGPSRPALCCFRAVRHSKSRAGESRIRRPTGRMRTNLRDADALLAASCS